MSFVLATLTLLVLSGYFVSFAWVEEKESVKMISADDWPSHGPWIVSVGNITY